MRRVLLSKIFVFADLIPKRDSCHLLYSQEGLLSLIPKRDTFFVFAAYSHEGLLSPRFFNGTKATPRKREGNEEDDEEEDDVDWKCIHLVEFDVEVF